jgi:hypothetical protein
MKAQRFFALLRLFLSPPSTIPAPLLGATLACRLAG